MTSADLATRRFRAIVEQLRDELGGDRGWKAEVARRLGISDAYVGYIEGDQRKAGLEAISAAIDRLHVDPAFFWDSSLGERPDFRQHLHRRRGRSVERELKNPQAWADFLEMYGRQLRPELTAEERDWLVELDGYRTTSAMYWQAIGLRRAGVPPEDAAHGAEVTADAQRRAESLGVPRKLGR